MHTPGQSTQEEAASAGPLTAAPTPRRRWRIPRPAVGALRHRDFRLFWWGQLGSLVGTWMQSTAQGWWVLERTNSAFYVGLTAALANAPSLLLSLVAGVVADRHDKRRILLTAQAVALGGAVLLGLLIHLQRLPLVLFLAVVTLVGVANAFEVPTRQAFFVELVGREDLPSAIALNSAAFNLSRIVGPALAGAVIARWGVVPCFYANALSYLAVIAALLRIRPRPRPRAPGAGGLWRDVGEGFRFLRRCPEAGALIAVVAALSLGALPYLALLPVFARDVLRVGARGLGALLAANGVGALLAGVLLAGWGRRLRRGPLLFVAAVGLGASVLAFATVRWPPLAALLLALAGFCTILHNATANALLQTWAPESLRSRVVSVYVFVFLGMAPLGSLAAGELAHRVGPRAAVAWGAATALGVTLAVWRRRPTLWRVR